MIPRACLGLCALSAWVLIWPAHLFAQSGAFTQLIDAAKATFGPVEDSQVDRARLQVVDRAQELQD